VPRDAPVADHRADGGAVEDRTGKAWGS
jgi:hypothetical protein